MTRCRASGGKIQWPSRRVALNAAWLIMLREHVVLGVYQCAHCARWHLTRQVWREGVQEPRARPGRQGV